MAQSAPIWEGFAIEYPPPPEWRGFAAEYSPPPEWRGFSIEVVGGLDSDTVDIVPSLAVMRLDLSGRGIGVDLAGLRGGI